MEVDPERKPENLHSVVARSREPGMLHTEGVLGLDGAVGGERLGLSLRVDGGDPEVVLLPLLEPRHVERQRPFVPGHLADLDPALRPRVELFDFVLLRFRSIEPYSYSLLIKACSYEVDYVQTRDAPSVTFTKWSYM